MTFVTIPRGTCQTCGKDTFDMTMDAGVWVFRCVECPEPDLKVALDLIESQLWEGNGSTCIGCGVPSYIHPHDEDPKHEPDCKAAALLRKHGRKVSP